jgi:hypothetical protein
MDCAICARPFTTWGGPIPEACEDRHGDIADALTGNLPAERQGEFDAHTKTCAGCAAELRELGTLASMLREGDVSADAVRQPIEPSPDLRARVVLAVDQASNETTVVPLSARRSRRSRPSRLAISVLGVAAGILVAIASVAVMHRSTDGGPRPEVVALAPKVATVSGASATAELQPQSFGTAIDLTASGLDDGTVYALWLADASGARAPAGTFVADRSGTGSLETATALRRVNAVKIWITDPAGATVLVAPLPTCSASCH